MISREDLEVFLKLAMKERYVRGNEDLDLFKAIQRAKFALRRTS